MKVILQVLFLIGLSQQILAEEDFGHKIYTPEVVYDHHNQGRKGAVQLLWQKVPYDTRYEVEVSNGNLVYSQVGEKHFHHIMIYFDKDYQWRVREVSANRTTEFSPWRPLKVLRASETLQSESEDLQQERQPVSVSASDPIPGENAKKLEDKKTSHSKSESEVEEYVLDTGDN